MNTTYEVPRLFHTTLKPDVALVTVTPPQDGIVSLGVSVDYGYEAVMTAKTVIAQVNDQMPFTYGKPVPVDKITYFVEHSAPVIELKPPTIGPVERAIGENCASLIQRRRHSSAGHRRDPGRSFTVPKGQERSGYSL